MLLLSVRPLVKYDVPVRVALTLNTTLLKVLLFDSVIPEPLPEEIVPPLSARVALPSVAAPPPTASEFAFSTKFSLPTPTALMPAFRLMLLCADKVSDTSVLLLLLMALLRVMSPNCAPPALVEMVTLIPAFSAAWMVPTVTTEESAVVVMLVGDTPKTPPTTLTPACGPTELIVTLFGSSSHKPALPSLPAPASANQPSVMVKVCLPEVSIAPPSPPWLPPRAATLP